MNKFTTALILTSLSVSAHAAPSFSLETGLLLDKTNSNITLVGPRAGVSLNFDIGDRFTISPTVRMSKLYRTNGELNLNLETVSVGVSARALISDSAFIGVGIYRNENSVKISQWSLSPDHSFNSASFELEAGMNITDSVSISYRPSVSWYFTNQKNSNGFWAGADDSDVIDNIAHSLNVQYRF